MKKHNLTRPRLEIVKALIEVPPGFILDVSGWTPENGVIANVDVLTKGQAGIIRIVPLEASTARETLSYGGHITGDASVLNAVRPAPEE